MTLNLHQLNTQQLAAVTLPSQDVLILAGAGSGKTKVLTSRIAWLIANNHVRPSQILAVTFTNKAAKEMLERVELMISLNSRDMWIGTFHGICHRLLRHHFLAANLPSNFQIIDTSEQLSLIKRVLKDFNLDEKITPAKALQNFINNHKEAGTRAEYADAGQYPKIFVEIYQHYQNICQSEGLLDFAELLLRAYELLSHNQPLQLHYQQRFKYILVDEFQDTNQLQYSWLLLLAGKSQQTIEQFKVQPLITDNLVNTHTTLENSIFAVGDDDQSIYSFRGASVANMQAFAVRFAKEIIRLEQNYRSGAQILGAANSLISANQSRLGKNLWSDSQSFELVNLYAANSDLEEASFVIDEIQKLHRQGINYAQMAILYRSNFQSRIFEQELFLRQIPYRIYGGNRFFDRQEIKHILAYCRLADNLADNSAFLRIVNFPARGIGEKSITKLQELAKQQGISFFAAIDSLSGKTSKALLQFQQLIYQIQQQIADKNLSKMIEIAANVSGIYQYYQNEDEAARLENLQELINAAAKFSEKDSSLNLSDFLAYCALESADSDSENSLDDPVQLMTIHAAKGLEFEVVFVAGVEQGLLPHQNSSSAFAQEEERRLFYVAITRAKRLLYFTYAHARMIFGKYTHTMLSSFIRDISQQYLHNLNATNSQSYDNDSYSQTFAQKPDETFIKANSSSSTKHSKYSNQITNSIQIGQQVKHKKFGLGTIINADNASDTRVLINFVAHGEKWLLLNFAQLEII